jgi:hypothetical protein
MINQMALFNKIMEKDGLHSSLAVDVLKNLHSYVWRRLCI